MAMAPARAARVASEMRAEAADKRRLAEKAGEAAREYLLQRAEEIERKAAALLEPSAA